MQSAVVRGQGLIEYGLIVALVALAAVGALGALGSGIDTTLYQGIIGKLP